MIIYIGHATSFDYQRELYQPLKNSDLWKQHSFVLPHDGFAQEPRNTKTIIQHCDLMIAEVSFPSTGLGIELGWADSYHRRIVCIYQTGTTPSSSLKAINVNLVEYDNTSMLEIFRQKLGL